eukprot:91792_1
MGCCGNQEEEPVVGEDLELGQDGSAVDEIESYEQSVEKMLGLSSGHVKIVLGVMAVIQVLLVVAVVWLLYKQSKTGGSDKSEVDSPDTPPILDDIILPQPDNMNTPDQKQQELDLPVD